MYMLRHRETGEFLKYNHFGEWMDHPHQLFFAPAIEFHIFCSESGGFIYDILNQESKGRHRYEPIIADTVDPRDLIVWDAVNAEEVSLEDISDGRDLIVLKENIHKKEPVDDIEIEVRVK